MKQYLTAGAVGALALAPAVAPVQATARVAVASSVTTRAARPAPKVTTTAGTVVAFRRATLRVASRGKHLDFVVTRASVCGTVRSGGGSPLSCTNLGRKQYRSQRVRVAWSRDARKRRVAASIILMLK